MDKVERLERRIEELENIIGMLVKSDRYSLSKDLEFDNGRNIILGQRTGTKIGLNAKDKLAFWGATPAVQGLFQPAPTGGSVVDVQARGVIVDILTDLIRVGINSGTP